MDNKTIKILIIDDNQDNIANLKALILNVFPEALVLTALNDHLGYKIAVAEEPDVIFLYMTMAVQDDFKFCTKLKTNEMLCDIPILFIAKDKIDKKSRSKALQCGAEGFLSKPIDESEVTAQIRAMIKIVNAKKEKTLINAIFDSIPGYLYVYDESGKLIKWNKKHETMTGYTAKELSHMTLEKWFDEEDMLKVNAAVNEVFQKGYGEVEASLILKSGEKMMIRSSGAPLVLEDQKYFTGIGIDITEQKKMECELKKSEERFRVAQEMSPDGFTILRPLRNDKGETIDFTLVYENQAIAHINQTDPQKVIGKRLLDLFPEHRGTSVLEAYKKVADTGETQILEEVSAGEIISKPVWLRLLVVSMGEEIAILSQDISERKKAEKALKESERKYSNYVENSPYGIFVVDEKGKYIDVNKAATQITGYSREELLRMNIRDIVAEESWKSAEMGFAKLLKTGAMSYEVKYINKNGYKKWLSIDAVKIDKNLYISFSSDITEKKEKQREIEYLNLHDHLTGLYNRRFFEEEVKRLDVERNLPLSIMVIDVNGLKLINDAFGHSKGDKILIESAQAIKNSIRADEIAARVGGDEFSIILPKCNQNQIFNIAERIKENIEKKSEEDIPFSLAIGVHTKEETKEDISDILKKAERKMYTNKIFSEQSKKSEVILMMISTLHEKHQREEEHSRRVSQLSYELGKAINIKGDRLEMLKTAGLLHDIGKIAIDYSIIEKAGRLTEDEYEEIKKHPEIGYRILKTSIEYEDISKIVLYHHERIDGSGYPEGIKENKIPLESKIICIADAYDAMVSLRPYKRKMTKEEAIDELKKYSNTQFDLNLVEVFTNRVLVR